MAVAVHGSCTKLYIYMAVRKLYIAVLYDVQGCRWLYMAIQCCTRPVHNCTWLYKAVDGCTKLYMAEHGCTRLYMGVQQCTRTYMAVQACT